MDFGDLVPIGVAFVVVGVVIGFGVSIVDDVRLEFVTNVAGCNATTRATCGAAYNATVDTVDGVSELASKLPLLGLVIAAAVIIGVLLKSFQQ